MTTINNILGTFAPITLEQMSSVKLMNMYNQHQWNHTNRQKIRFRTYCVSGLQFMEVKTKNNHGRTKKKRIEVSNMDVTEQQCRLFLGRHLRYDVDTLQPAHPGFGIHV